MGGRELTLREMLKVTGKVYTLGTALIRSLSANGGSGHAITALLNEIETRAKEGDRTEIPDPFQALSRRLVGPIWDWVGKENAVELEINWVEPRDFNPVKLDTRVRFARAMQLAQLPGDTYWRERRPSRVVDRQREHVMVTTFKYWLVHYPWPVLDGRQLTTGWSYSDWALESNFPPRVVLMRDVKWPQQYLPRDGWEFAGLQELIVFVAALEAKHLYALGAKPCPCRIIAPGAVLANVEHDGQELPRYLPWRVPEYIWKQGDREIRPLETRERHRYGTDCFFLVRERQN